MSIVLRMILFIVGFAFLLETQNAIESASSVDTGERLEEGLNKVIEQINKRLSWDIDDYHTGEVYDYPGEDDTWLASLEPAIWYYDTNQPNIYYWPHITDLWDDWAAAYKPFPEMEELNGNVVLNNKDVPYYDPPRDINGNHVGAHINFDNWVNFNIKIVFL